MQHSAAPTATLSPRRLMRRKPRRDEFMQSLEIRQMFAVSLDSRGFTDVTRASDTVVIYVSSSDGNDADDGRTPETAVASINRAKGLVRNGSADWMLLKRDDVFHESFGSWNKWGRSPQEPLLIGAYGTGERPLIDSGNSYGLNTVTSSNPDGVENLVITSLAFFPSGFNHDNGGADLAALRLTGKGNNILVEDVKAQGYKDNIVIGGESAPFTVSDVTVRRSQILDSHSGVGNSQGIYLGRFAQNITIEQNVIDHNGWRAAMNADRVDKNHNVYSQVNASNVIIRDNIISEASFYGLKFNSGGSASGNFFIRNSESVYLELPSDITGNVITEAVDMPQFPNQGWGVGINTQKTPQATIRRNLITNVLSTMTSGIAGIQLYNNSTPFTGLVEDNVIYKWRNGLAVGTPGNGPGSVVIRNNQVHAVFSDTAAADQRPSANPAALVYEGNDYSAGSRTSTANRINGVFQALSSWTNATHETAPAYALPNYPDPNRDIARYNAAAGGPASFDAFINAARSQNKANWNVSYTAAKINAWYWDGFTTTSSVTALSGAVNVDTSPQSFQLVFSSDIGTSLSTGDVVLTNLSTGASAGLAGVNYSPASATAVVTAAAPLADGNYRALIPAGAISADGRPSGSDITFDFFIYRGDANHNRAIEIQDFAILAAHWNAPATFSQGDFNYSGRADLNDFAILASRFNQSLPLLRKPQRVVAGAEPALSAPIETTANWARETMTRSLFADNLI